MSEQLAIAISQEIHVILAWIVVCLAIRHVIKLLDGREIPDPLLLMSFAFLVATGIALTIGVIFRHNDTMYHVIRDCYHEAKERP